MTVDDMRQLEKSSIAYLLSSVYSDSDSATAIMWGGFRVEDISAPQIVFCVTGASTFSVQNVTRYFTTIPSVVYFINFTTIQLDTGT